MDSYVEVTVLLGSLLMFSSQLWAAWLCQRRISLKRLLYWCWIAPLGAALGWFNGGTLIAAGLELITAAAVFSFCLPAMIFAWGIRFLISFGLMKLMHGSLVRFQLFLPAGNTGWLIAAGVLLILDWLIQRRLGQSLARTAYLYPVILDPSGQKIAMTGYLDSGNSAVIAGRPLIFAVPEIRRLLGENGRNLMPLEIETVRGPECIEALTAEIQLQGHAKCDVWLAFSETLTGSGYDALLNIGLFTVKE